MIAARVPKKIVFIMMLNQFLAVVKLRTPVATMMVGNEKVNPRTGLVQDQVRSIAADSGLEDLVVGVHTQRWYAQKEWVFESTCIDDARNEDEHVTPTMVGFGNPGVRIVPENPH
jgi:hypothetical protein